ncbi:isoform a [Stylonychia lemnae]|uniref:FACT complex subunit n=1 Tax=Stylonychia lemnae TaxID=5949 RepID=A0A078B4A6_STYLE|nr:isoform a [Stylonychia lemnae]|eukprot:CDW89086.1 isoform a [Stylonychia lemnae]
MESEIGVRCIFIYTRKGKGYRIPNQNSTSPQLAYVISIFRNNFQNFLDALRPPENYLGPRLTVVLRDTKQDQTKQINQFLDQLQIQKDVGSFPNEELIGDFSNEFKRQFNKKFQVASKDCNKFFEELLLTKDQFEIESLKIAALFSEYVMKELIKDCEQILELGKLENHDIISGKIEMILDKEEKLKDFYKTIPKTLNNEYDSSCLEFQYQVGIQSGGQYNLKMGAPNNQSPLSPDTILLSVCNKYKDICCNISRTIIINLVDEQKHAYIFLNDMMNYLISLMMVDKKISDIYKAFIEQVKSKGKENHLAHLPKVLGYGIGIYPKEDLLSIKEDNEKIIEAGMVFNLRLSLANFQLTPNRNCLLIADTILIKPKSDDANRNVDILTRDEDPTAAEEKADKSKKKPVQTQNIKEKLEKSTKLGVVQVERLRQQNPTMVGDDVKRKEHQKELMFQKQEELKLRLADNDLQFTGKNNSKVKDLDAVISYKSQREFPRECQNYQLYIDKNKNTILIPFRDETGQMMTVPFHIQTIKNASINTENNVSNLRINFHFQGQGISSKEVNFPSMRGPNQVFIKEITIKSQNTIGLTASFKALKEILKKIKQEDQIKSKSGDAKEEDAHLSDETLILSKGKKVVLDKISIKPTFVGKKTVGQLETHINGFRFMSNKGHKVDITYNNIRQAFFQPCENDLIVLLHFRLKAPISVGNKKTLDIQLYTEICALVDDLDSKQAARKRLNEQDEFTQAVEAFALENKYEIEFDVPFKDLEFTGCHAKSNVKIVPTRGCLIALSELPFFVLDLSQVEIAHFERVSFMTRNFDMIFVLKDFQTFKRISTIPNQLLDTIKSWLDTMNIIYSEGPICLNWPTILDSIREDFDSYINDGGWGFLFDEEVAGGYNQEVSGDEDESDSEYNETEDEEEEEGSESSGSEFSEEASAESSDVQPDDEEEEEGMDWDEMERQTIEQDRRQNELAKRRFQEEEHMKKIKGPSNGGGNRDQKKQSNGQNQISKVSGFNQTKTSLMGKVQKRR